MTDRRHERPTAEQDSTRYELPEPATLIFRRTEYPAKPGSTVRAAIKSAGLNPETVLATRNGELITDEVVIEPGDRIKLVATISGG